METLTHENEIQYQPNRTSDDRWSRNDGDEQNNIRK